MLRSSWDEVVTASSDAYQLPGDRLWEEAKESIGGGFLLAELNTVIAEKLGHPRVHRREMLPCSGSIPACTGCESRDVVGISISRESLAKGSSAGKTRRIRCRRAAISTSHVSRSPHWCISYLASMVEGFSSASATCAIWRKIRPAIRSRASFEKS